MNDSIPEIAFIPDRSGPMESMVEPALSGFKRLLREHDGRHPPDAGRCHRP